MKSSDESKIDVFIRIFLIWIFILVIFIIAIVVHEHDLSKNFQKYGGAK
jgi:hypothetical protein